MSCDDCISVFLHEGKPSGTFSQIDDIKVYVSKPSDSQSDSQKAILIFPDVYGVELKNTQLISDRLAEEVGVTSYLIDYLVDPAPEPGTQPDFSLPDWLKGHGPELVIPKIEKVINHLKSNGTNQFAAIGFCFGGKYIFRYAQENKIKVGAVSHPSLLKNPEDIKDLLEKSNVPMLINSCEVDQRFPIDFQKVTDEILGDGKYKPGYKRNYYPGATHGFGCRADLSKPSEKEAFDKSFVETVNWFKTHL
ncbi:Alpha/Beta hydrolase protein [Phakopsora pachyrhizi]|nr:Alpha/Beta hydrolase protein [Phakopsora pachyrhizi]